MLSDERIKQLACVYMEGDVDRECERAIRLAVAEAVEACAMVCDDKAQELASSFSFGDWSDMDLGCESCAAAIREKAREKK